MICSASIAYQNEWIDATIGSEESPVTILTAPVSGLYRVTLGGAIAFSAETGGASVTMQWQNPSGTAVGNLSIEIGTVSETTTRVGVEEESIYLASGDTLSLYSIVETSGTIVSAAIFMTIEQLQ